MSDERERVATPRDRLQRRIIMGVLILLGIAVAGMIALALALL